MKNAFSRLLFLSACLLILGHSYSQGQRPVFSVTGHVTDAAGKALQGASVQVRDQNKAAITDSSGLYRISLVAGQYTLQFSFEGFITEFRTAVVSGPVSVDASLRDAVTEHEAVIVTGVSSATRVRENPQPVEVVRRASLLQHTSSNVIDALSSVPGVSAVTTGPAVSKPFIRGLGYNRVLTINDGVRQEGQQWGDEHGIEIDDYSVQRIEVLKGPASLIYGSDALAGVINIQSQVPAPEGTFKGSFLSEYQTNARLRGFAGDFGGTKNGFSFHAYASYKGAWDYRNKYDGPVFNSKFHEANFGGLVGYAGNWGHSNVLVTSFDEHLGVVEGERDSATGRFVKDIPGGGNALTTDADFNSTDPLIGYQRIRHFKVTSDNSFNFGNDRLDVLLAFQRNQRQEFGDPDHPAVADAWFDLRTFTYSLGWHFAAKNHWRTSLGVNGMFQSNLNRGAEAIIPDYNQFDIGGYVFTQYHKNRLSLSGGVRVDNRSVDGKLMQDGATVKFDRFERNFGNVSASAGVSYEASDNVTLKFNLARGFRAPSLAELASNGAHEGTNRFEVGDHSLSSETSTQADAGLEIVSQHVTFSTSLFFNHIANFIYYRNVLGQGGGDSLRNDPVTGDVFYVFRFAQQTANLYGAEANFDIHPHPLDWLHIENTFSYTRARFTEAVGGSFNVPFIPAARYIAEIRGNFLPHGKGIRNLYAGFESDYTFRQDQPFTGFGTETPTGSYWLLSASAGTDVTNSRGKLLFSIHLTGNNLSDIAYQNNLSRFKYLDINNATGRQGVFNMGRNFGVKLNVPLDLVWK